MKALSYVGIVIGILGLGLGIYNHVEYVPKNTEEGAEIFGTELWLHYHETMIMYGNIELITGLLAIILGVIAAMKKEKLGYIATGIGVVTIFFGLLHATHMFS